MNRHDRKYRTFEIFKNMKSDYRRRLLKSSNLKLFDCWNDEDLEAFRALGFYNAQSVIGDEPLDPDDYDIEIITMHLDLMLTRLLGDNPTVDQKVPNSTGFIETPSILITTDQYVSQPFGCREEPTLPPDDVDLTLFSNDCGSVESISIRSPDIDFIPVFDNRFPLVNSEDLLLHRTSGTNAVEPSLHCTNIEPLIISNGDSKTGVCSLGYLDLFDQWFGDCEYSTTQKFINHHASNVNYYLYSDCHSVVEFSKIFHLKYGTDVLLYILSTIPSSDFDGIGRRTLFRALTDEVDSTPVMKYIFSDLSSPSFHLGRRVLSCYSRIRNYPPSVLAYLKRRYVHKWRERQLT